MLRRARGPGCRSLAALATVATVAPLFAPAFAAPPPRCADPGVGWCVVRRFSGDVPGGELGFRFGEPLDVDGDRHADVAAGARFKLQGVHQAGEAGVWSGANGRLLRKWEGPDENGLFGHWVLPIPDLDGDSRADVVIAAPSATVDGVMRGVVSARSPKTGKELWRQMGAPISDLGWDLALAGDQNGDGLLDLFVGQIAMSGGRVLLVSGKDGTVLQTYAPPVLSEAFGWYVARVDDLDGDGRPDLAVGAPPGRGPDDPPNGEAYVIASGTGQALQHWKGTDPLFGFGEVVAGLGDVDGDRRPDVVVTAAGTTDQARTRPGDVYVYSGATGVELRHWTGTQPGELFGRMAIDTGDLDADGVDDVAIGAPWHRTAAGDHVGRVELRSGKTGAVLTELLGEGPESWFGWHMRRAPDPEGRGRPALLVGSLRQPVRGVVGVGVIDLWVRRAPGSSTPQGTSKRGGRRSDIK